MIYGIDVGGTKIEVAIFDSQMSRQTSWRVPTPTQDYRKFLTVIERLVQQADEKSGQKGSLGIGLPCFFDVRNRAMSSNILCIHGQKIEADLSLKLDRPIAFTNDAKAFALSEACGGVADRAESVLGLILGTGVAGGLCINGQTYQGRQNIAGEFGHTPLGFSVQQRHSFPSLPCGCGLFGCAERYLSGPGLLWMSNFFGSDYQSVPEFMASVRAKDKAGLKAFSAYMDCLGFFIAKLTLMFDPDVIVLGGGLSNVHEIYEQLPAAVGGHLFQGVNAPPVLKPKYGDSSGVRGAALLGHLKAEAAVSLERQL